LKSFLLFCDSLAAPRTTVLLVWLDWLTNNFNFSGDPRFGFLDASHEFHPYYEHKIRVYQGLEPPYVQGQGPPPQSGRKKKKKKKKEKTKSLLLPQYETSSSDSDNDVPNTASKKTKSSKTQGLYLHLKFQRLLVVLALYLSVPTVVDA